MSFQIQSWPTPEIFIAALRKAFTKTFATGITPWTNLNSYAHGFGSVPTACGGFIVCISADAGFSVGDRVDMDNIFDAEAAQQACTIKMNTTQIATYTIDITGTLSVCPNGGGGSTVTLDPSKWDVFMWAFQF